jgi:hypothetical protein
VRSSSPTDQRACLVGLLNGTDAKPPKLLEIVPADKAANKLAQTKPNPDYDSWISRDQIVLGYLLQSLLPHIQQIGHAAGV